MRTLAALLCPAALLTAQVARHANENYRTEQQRAGITRTLTAADRDERQRPKELIAALELRPGMTVIDVGTGPGYMLPYLSAAVSPSGRVIAQDIFPDFLEQARRRADERELVNITYIRGDERDARLPEAAGDVMLVLDAYHHFDYPAEMLASLRRALKPDGRLVLVEYHKSKEAMGGRGEEHVRLGMDDAIREIEANGFKLVSRRDFVPKVQWIAVFRRN
ncbi:MAG TPA: methyltransferase domain-containing protein [Bryobacteraceae bacterium]|nr:methyltransferase domain-containing protein [Bryobacteraceae bacterium]